MRMLRPGYINIALSGALPACVVLRAACVILFAGVGAEGGVACARRRALAVAVLGGCCVLGAPRDLDGFEGLRFGRGDGGGGGDARGELPEERAVQGEAVEVAVPGAEGQAVLEQGGRAVDRAVGREGPLDGAGGGVKAIDEVAQGGGV